MILGQSIPSLLLKRYNFFLVTCPIPFYISKSGLKKAKSCRTEQNW